MYSFLEHGINRRVSTGFQMKIKLKKKNVALPFSNIRRMCRIMFLFRYDLEYSRLLDCFLLFIIPRFPRCSRSGRERGGGEAEK